MKKKLLMAGLLLCISLAGCGDAKQEVTEAPKASESVATVTEEPKQEESQTVEVAAKKVTAGPQLVCLVKSQDIWMEGSGDLDGYEFETPQANVHYEMLYPVAGANTALAKAIDQMNQEIIAEYEACVDGMLSMVEDMDEDSLEYAFFPWNDTRSTYATRCDSQLISIAANYDSYYGGAHPSYYTIGRTLNTQTGSEIRLGDLVTDYDKLFEAVKAELADYEYADEFFDTWEDDVYNYFYGEYIFNSWVAMADGVNIWFDPYAIGPYALGMVDLYLTKDKYPDLFVDEFFYEEDDFDDTADVPYVVLPESVIDFIEELEPKMGSISFEEVLAFYEEKGMEVSADYPSEESDGIITFEADGLNFALYFVPEYYEDGGVSDECFLDNIWVSRGDETLVLSKNVTEEQEYLNVYTEDDYQGYNFLDSVEMFLYLLR